MLYSRPYTKRLRYSDIKALADAIAAPPRSWTPDAIWRAYAALDSGKVRGSTGTTLTNIVSLVRYATQQTDELTPFPEQALARYDAWLAQQDGLGRSFSAEQRRWLDDIAAHIASSLRIEPDDFDSAPFGQRGGLGKVYQLFGPDYEQLLDELNETLIA